RRSHRKEQAAEKPRTRPGMIPWVSLNTPLPASSTGHAVWSSLILWPRQEDQQQEQEYRSSSIQKDIEEQHVAIERSQLRAGRLLVGRRANVYRGSDHRGKCTWQGHRRMLSRHNWKVGLARWQLGRLRKRRSL